MTDAEDKPKPELGLDKFPICPRCGVRHWYLADCNRDVGR
jgi:hypothetical protein